jgi:MoxR-like ATPase
MTYQSPTVIIYGPQGCGKTRNAEQLRQAFGLERVIELDDGDTQAIPSHGALVLTNRDDATSMRAPWPCRRMSFDQAMSHAGMVPA